MVLKQRASTIVIDLRAHPVFIIVLCVEKIMICQLVQKMPKCSLPTFCKNCYISHLKSVVPLIEQWVETLKLLGNQIIEPNGIKYN